MAKDRGNSKGFLARLLRNQTGNVIAMTAAAIIPMIGLIGGAVDMGRLYAVKSRLQSACDSGALAGRRVMGTGRWTDNSGRANTIALSTFDLNFADGSFGSSNKTRSFTETDGTVDGIASADVPMTLMRVFGIATKTINVTCEGTMRIPNTDVMFVLDNSGSMNEVIPGDSTGMTKMVGLRTAIKCFYEALARQNITDVSPSQCGTTSDPTGGLSTQVQLRFGFVNYDHMVNVGQLLPNSYLVDNWTYQSRAPNMDTVHTWTTGTPTTPTYGNWSGPPDSFSDPSGYSSTWTTLTASSYALADGYTYPNPAVALNSAACTALNQFGSYDQMVGISESYGNAGTATYTPTDNDPPDYPASIQNVTASQNRTATVSYGYRYAWVSNSCKMQRSAKSGTKTYTQTHTGPASRSINWTDYQRVVNWTYKPVQFDVSSLKAGGSSWNSAVSLPIGEVNSPSLKLSGSNTAATFKVLSNTSVAWAGCIEERQTYQNTDGDGSDDWNNYPSQPADAIDMDIDRVPDSSDPRTQWRPALNSAVWGRKDTLTGTTWSGNLTTDPITGAASSTRNLATNNCGVTPSRKLLSYSGKTGELGPTDFTNYVNSIDYNGNTYHDIGLLWGARLMSPTGIFGSENALTPGGAQITRHLIFMTDGATANTNNNYDSYGISWWDRRQFNTGASNTQLQNNNNARSNALCTAIKNKNITLWVIFYGPSTDTTTMNRLKACATSLTYFYQATDTPTLISKFREIADKISNLRLTE